MVRPGSRVRKISSLSFATIHTITIESPMAVSHSAHPSFPVCSITVLPCTTSSSNKCSRNLTHLHEGRVHAVVQQPSLRPNVKPEPLAEGDHLVKLSHALPLSARSANTSAMDPEAPPALIPLRCRPSRPPANRIPNWRSGAGTTAATAAALHHCKLETLEQEHGGN